jgi:predicted ATPase/DNA-binding CsgD family transcriptional regulator
MHGFWPGLTSFIGRAGQVEEVASLLRQYRLLTVTGPGGVGKTRLAAEVAAQVSGRFADGVWLAELAAVQEPAVVSATVAAVLGLRQATGTPTAESLADVLAQQQLLLVLDNCEHLLGAAAELCLLVLRAADDVRILATSREPIGVPGEARYRLPPLGLRTPGEQAEAGGSEAVALFLDRARQMDPHFTLTEETGPLVARLVERLDGMPLAIELAAGRVEALGVTQLVDGLDDRFELLAGFDRTAAARHRSLAAAVEWSYQLLGEHERRVFRRLAIFPGPFTLAAADSCAGAGAGQVVLHLVDCSLLVPPRTSPDGRARYLMLETLRAYGLELLADTGEEPEAAAALTGHALLVAEQAGADMQTGTGEAAAAQWLDAEDANVHQGLAWALEHDPAAALRLAIALAPWWHLRGRSAAGYPLLRAAAEHAARDEHAWCAAQLWLGQTAMNTGDMIASLGHFTAIRDAISARGPSPMLVDCLSGRSITQLNLGRIPEGTADARRALAMARELVYPAGEALALLDLSVAASHGGYLQEAVAWARQIQQVDPAAIPGWVGRLCSPILTAALIDAGEMASARRSCANGLDRSQEAGYVQGQASLLAKMSILDLQARRISDARAHLREALELANRIGDRAVVADCLDQCGHLCGATQRQGEAITVWAASAECLRNNGIADLPQNAQRRQEPMRKARQALGPGQMRAAWQRGTAMTLAAAAEFATMLTAPDSHAPQAPSAPGRLSPREEELVTLVAQGRTDTQIAGQLNISVRTVRSHLDRIRDKTGCRRRADLTRLALRAGLV